MAYCTNCGKEMTAKKICEHCGVKKNKTHNFCEWCGTALDQKAKVCPNCQEPKKVETVAGKAVSTFFAVLFLIGAIGAIGQSFVTAVCFLLFALLLLPFTKGLIRKATHDNMKLRKTLKPVRVIALIALLLIGGSALPETETSNNNAEINSSQSTKSDYVELNEKEIDALVADALYKEIDGNKNYRSNLDPGACKYEISSIEDEEKQYVVYGNGWFYDKYGQPCKPYSDNSGSYSFTFEIKINKTTGRVSVCKIK